MDVRNVFEFADMISSCSNGKYMVFMPNYLRNTPYTLDPKWGNEFATWWDTIGNLDKTINEFTKVVLPFIKKEYKITNICTLGTPIYIFNILYNTQYISQYITYHIYIYISIL